MHAGYVCGDLGRSGRPGGRFLCVRVTCAIQRDPAIQRDLAIRAIPVLSDAEPRRIPAKTGLRPVAAPPRTHPVPDLRARLRPTPIDVPYAYPVCVAIRYRQISYTAHRESHSTYPILTTALLHVKVWHSRLDQWQLQATHDSSGGPLQLAPECGVEVVTLGLVRPVVADVQVAATHRGQNEHGVSRLQMGGGFQVRMAGREGGEGGRHLMTLRCVPSE